MTRRGERILGTLKYLCVLYFAFVILSFGLSQALPSFDAIREVSSENCYWTNAVLGYVECGNAVPSSGGKEFIYNFWLRLIYSPISLFAGSLWQALWTLALYAPFAALAVTLLKKRRTKRSSQ